MKLNSSHEIKGLQKKIGPSPCRLCSHTLNGSPLLEFKNMPGLAQNFPDIDTVKFDFGVDLSVLQCLGCGLVQLDTPPVSYYRDVIRAAGYSQEMANFRRTQFQNFVSKFALTKKKVIEIGCGRGEYLQLMRDCEVQAFGIEHLASSVDFCVKNGLSVEENFIENATQKINGGPFAAFYILNFLEHIPNLNLFLRGIGHNLEEEGIGLVEVPNFDMMIERKMFSEFMTDHLTYFTEQTLKNALNWNGFEIIDSQTVWHSYILSVTVRKRRSLDLTSFKNFSFQIIDQLKSYLDEFPLGRVAVWGAGHQALAVLSLAQMGDKIKFVIDSALVKQGKFTPVTHIPIVSPQVLENDLTIQAIIIMAAGYSDEISTTIQTQYLDRFKICILRSEGLERISPRIS